MKNLVIQLILSFSIAHYAFSEANPVKTSEVVAITVTGKVIDKASRNPIEYAQIALFKQVDSSLVTGSLTDSSGVFIIKKVPYGNYFITAEFIGYKKFVKHDVIITSGKSAIILDNIQLEINTKELGQVDVVSTADAMNIKIDKKVLNVDKNLSAKGGTAIDALKTSPSVTVNQDGEVLLRGSKSFKVLVNGKPTALKPNDALKQMPAGKIDKIELITNPSAKYDAEGTAGIINIITKKGMGAGTSALVNVSAGTGNKYNADINLNYNSDKLNITIGGKWKDYQDFYNMDEILRTTRDGSIRNNDIDFYRLQTNKDLGLNVTLDYDINSKNNISYSADAGYTDFYVDANFKYDETVENQTGHNYVYEDLHTGILADYFTNNLSYTYKFNEKSSWANSIFYSHINYLFNNNQNRYNTSADFISNNITLYYTMRLENDNFSSEIRAKSDFSTVFKNNAKFEMGGQYHQYHRYLDLIAENYLYDSNSWIIDPIFTNEFDFNEQIYSGYVNYSGEKAGFTYNAGFRLEYIDRLIESFTINEKYEYQKLHYFPTLSLSKSIDKSNQLTLSYSRRIDRPDEYFLNPFPDVSNEFQTAYGNPLLRPNLTDSYEFSYQRRFSKGMFSSQAFARITNDAYTQVIGSDTDGIMVLTFDNISDDKEFGIENMVNIQATKWYSLNASLNFMGQNSVGTMNDEAFNHSAFTFDARLINSFSISKNTSAQLMAFYFHDRLGNAIGSVEKFYWIDASIQHSFFNKRLSVTIQAKDIFNTNQLKFDIDRSDYRFFVHRKPEYPVILFNISYKFNNYKGKKAIKTKLKLG